MCGEDLRGLSGGCESGCPGEHGSYVDKLAFWTKHGRLDAYWVTDQLRELTQKEKIESFLNDGLKKEVDFESDQRIVITNKDNYDGFQLTADYRTVHKHEGVTLVIDTLP